MRAWAATQSAESCAVELTANGIAAAVVLDGNGLMRHSGQLWDTALTRLADGALVKGFPFQLDAAPLRIARDAPRVGADTAEILSRIGGYTPAEIAEFAGKGVIEVARG